MTSPLPGSAPEPVAPDSLVFSLAFETWSDAVGGGIFSGHMLAKYLVRAQPVDALLIADPWRSVLSRLRRRASFADFPSTDFQHHISPQRLRRRDPTDFGAVRRSHGRYLQRVRSAAARARISDPVLIATHPFTAAAARTADWRRVVYYGWDDWAAHPSMRPWHPAFLSAYRAIRAEGHSVAAVTSAIVDRIDSPGPSMVLPNGLDPDEWQQPVPAPGWFVDLPAPRMLYAGTIGSRIDVEAIRQLAAAMPDASIVMVGEILEPQALSAIEGLPNVHIRARQSRAVVRGMTFACDVALIPHVVNDLTRAMSPLKLYEYLAAGKPVVATDLEPIRKVGGSRLYTTPEGFVSQVQDALAAAPVSDAHRLAFVRDNSWDSRFERLLKFSLP